jgi:cytosine/adenosine deaminase-related metal-dependent hydrolase
MRSGSLTISARWIVPVEGEPIRDGRLTILDGRVSEIAPDQGQPADVRFPRHAIVPGFVNAHTHLELSEVGPRSEGVEDEIAWLGRVIAQRRESTPESMVEAVGRNLAASIESGTTMLADITTAGLSWPQVADAPLRAVVFAEMIGLKRERAMETTHAAFEWLGSIRPEAMVAGCARPGLSPHAPYSTAGWVFERAALAGAPLCTHLAEIAEEHELLVLREGRLREFLERINAWDDEWVPLGDRPADYVRKGNLRRADWLIAHGNYLEEIDFWQLRPEASPEGQRVAVAYCPRTAARFGHDRSHPFRAMLGRGVVVCLGTDSLASAPTLSVLDEARALRRSAPDLSGRLVLTMATLFGAWALRAETVTGSLKPGKSADLAVVELPELDDDPYEAVLDSDLPVVATMFEGTFTSGPYLGL